MIQDQMLYHKKSGESQVLEDQLLAIQRVEQHVAP